MSRIDKPTMECDRCKWRTQDLPEMGKFYRLTHGHMSGEKSWDLCPRCLADFIVFMAEENNQ